GRRAERLPGGENRDRITSFDVVDARGRAYHAALTYRQARRVSREGSRFVVQHRVERSDTEPPPLREATDRLTHAITAGFGAELAQLQTSLLCLGAEVTRAAGAGLPLHSVTRFNARFGPADTNRGARLPGGTRTLLPGRAGKLLHQ